MTQVVVDLAHTMKFWEALEALVEEAEEPQAHLQEELAELEERRMEAMALLEQVN
jgi:hypothetical protein